MQEREKTGSRWRTLIDFVAIEDKVAKVIIPGWRPDCEIYMPLGTFPEEIQTELKKGRQFLLAVVDLSALTPLELRPSDFELAPKDTPEDIVLE